MFSYWEQESFSYYNHIIIGSGIVGLSTAIELKERRPDCRVLVLERGLLPTGASTRNAGFACMGSVTELLDDLEHATDDEVVALFRAASKDWKGCGRGWEMSILVTGTMVAMSSLMKKKKALLRK